MKILDSFLLKFKLKLRKENNEIEVILFVLKPSLWHLNAPGVDFSTSPIESKQYPISGLENLKKTIKYALQIEFRFHETILGQNRWNHEGLEPRDKYYPNTIWMTCIWDHALI